MVDFNIFIADFFTMGFVCNVVAITSEQKHFTPLRSNLQIARVSSFFCAPGYKLLRPAFSRGLPQWFASYKSSPIEKNCMCWKE